VAAETPPPWAAIVASSKNTAHAKKGATMTVTNEKQHHLRELAHRATDGLEVILF
jgi:hypothetical protein